MSLLLHAIVGLTVHRFAPTPDGPEIITLAQRPQVVQVSRATPKPARTPPIAAPRAKPTIEPVRHTSKKASAVVAAAVRRPTPTPVPIASAPPPSSAPCLHATVPASILATPPPPAIALPVRADATSGTTRVRVQLDAHGAVIGTKIVASSGNSSLDLVAIAMARAAHYAPALAACKPIASTYAFSAKFVAW